MKGNKKLNLLRALLVLACCLLAAGLLLPMFTVTQFWLVNHSLSVVSGIYELWQKELYPLVILIFVFSIVLPIAKIALLFKVLNNTQGNSAPLQHTLRLMHDYGRWGMLDVLVVAVLVVSVKLGAIASIEIHPGLYVFGAAVLLIMWLTHQVMNLLEQ